MVGDDDMAVVFYFRMVLQLELQWWNMMWSEVMENKTPILQENIEMEDEAIWIG